MHHLCNSGERKRRMLREAEANLASAARAFTAAGDGKGKERLRRKVHERAEEVLHARLAYLKARRWVLLDEPTSANLQRFSRELEAIAKEEARTEQGGKEAVLQEALEKARSGT